MGVRPVGAEFHADGQTCEADSRFLQFSERSKKLMCIIY